jgi:hypothetical protein
MCKLQEVEISLKANHLTARPTGVSVRFRSVQRIADEVLVREAQRCCRRNHRISIGKPAQE